MDALLETEDKDWRYLSCKATGDIPEAATSKARDAEASPSALIIFNREGAVRHTVT